MPNFLTFIRLHACLLECRIVGYCGWGGKVMFDSFAQKCLTSLQQLSERAKTITCRMQAEFQLQVESVHIMVTATNSTFLKKH